MVSADLEFIAATSDLVTTASPPTEGRLLDSSIGTDWMRINLGAHNGKRARTLTLRPFGKGADNSTFTLVLWGRRRTSAARNSAESPVGPAQASADGSVIKLGTLVCTLSAAVGVSGGMIGTSYRFADTLAWTAETYWTSLATAFGVDVVVHSPGSDKLAEFIIPDAGGLGEIIVTGTLGTATAWNCLAERQS